MAWVRLFTVPFALLEVGVFKTHEYPDGYEQWAWAVTAVFAVGAIALLALAYRASWKAWRTIGLAALLFDSAIVYGYILVFAFEPGTPVRQLVFVPLIEAAMRYGVVGGVGLAASSAVALGLAEWWRVDHFDSANYEIDRITFPVGIQLILGLVVGSLVERLREQRREAGERASEAEALRDELGRRADLLDATNRCARGNSASTRTPAHATPSTIRIGEMPE